MTSARLYLAAIVMMAASASAQAVHTSPESLRTRADLIRELTATLASRSFEGRGTGQRGGERAATYIAKQFARLGLRAGGGDTAYLQSFQVAERVPLGVTALVVRGRSFSIALDFGIAEPPPPYELEPFEGDIVFVGYGVVSPDFRRDDLAGLDLRGKVVMVLEGAPKNADTAQWSKFASQRAVFANLIQRGARGFLVVYGGEPRRFPGVAAFLSNRTLGFTEDIPFPVQPARWSLELLYPEFALPASLLVAETVADHAFALRHLTFASVKARAEKGEFVSRDLHVDAAFTPRVRKSVQSTGNVIGWIEGSDPVLKTQAVIVSAHYDAYGVSQNGTIFPGATDNALGVAKLVGVAAALTAPSVRPRRSVIFIASTGEEHGDLGIAHWLRHPTWPLQDVAADVNFDGSVTELWGPLGFIVNYSFGQSDLGPLVRRAAATRNVEVIPDPLPGEDYFTRADHWAFVQRGIPALYLVGGPLDPSVAERAAQWTASSYHMPSDSVRSNWRWEGPAQMTGLAADIVRQIADADAMPQWRPNSRYNRPRGSEPGTSARPAP